MTTRTGWPIPDWWRDSLAHALKPHGAARRAIAAVKERCKLDIREADVSKFLSRSAGLNAVHAVALSHVLGMAPPIFLPSTEAESKALLAEQMLFLGSTRKDGTSLTRTVSVTQEADRLSAHAATSARDALTRRAEARLARIKTETSGSAQAGERVRLRVENGGNQQDGRGGLGLGGSRGGAAKGRSGPVRRATSARDADRQDPHGS